MAELYANSGDLDQTPRSVAFDLCLHCLPITLLGVPRLQRVKCAKVIAKQDNIYLFERENSELFSYCHLLEYIDQ